MHLHSRFTKTWLFLGLFSLMLMACSSGNTGSNNSTASSGEILESEQSEQSAESQSETIENPTGNTMEEPDHSLSSPSGFEEELLELSGHEELTELPFDTSGSPYPYVGLKDIDGITVISNYKPENYTLDLQSFFAYAAREINTLRTELKQEDPAAVKTLAEITAYYYNSAGPYSAFLSEKEQIKEQTGQEKGTIYYDVQNKEFVEQPIEGSLILEYYYDFSDLLDSGGKHLELTYGFWGDKETFFGSFDKLDFTILWQSLDEMEASFERGNFDEFGEKTGVVERFTIYLAIHEDNLDAVIISLSADYNRKGKSEDMGSISDYLIQNKKSYI